MVLDLASNKPKMIRNFTGVIDTGNGSFAGINDTYNAQVTGGVNTVRQSL